MRTRLPALVLIAVMCSTAGCGGGSSKTPAQASKTLSQPESKTLSQPELIAKADAICTRLNAKLAAGPTARKLQDIVRIAPQGAAIEMAAVNELGKLTPPTAIAHDWQQILVYRRMLAEDLVKYGQEAKLNNVQRAHVLFRSGAILQRQMAATAKRDGFKACVDLG